MNDGQLEFINGGWSANDEACPIYEEIIMNMFAGHSFLKRTFGIIPKHAWHIDAFGHTAATPELFMKMGFESITFARINDDEKTYRINNKELEFIWKPFYEGVNKTYQSDSGIFSHILQKHYDAPCGFE